MLRKVLLGLGITVVVIAALAIWRAEEIGRLLAVNTLFSEERIVENFSSMDTMFRSRPVPVTGDVETFSVQPLPLPATLDVAGETLDVAEYLADTATTSLLILRDGKIAHEEYFLGTGPDDLRISWSMAKSILSVAMGVAVADGLVDLDRTVESYVPALTDSAYNGVTVRNALNMASGVVFNEDYLDFWSDINRMGRVLALGGSMDEFAAGISERQRAPGTVRQYVSIDTHVLAMVLRAATGSSLADYIGEKIFSPIGLEREPYYLTDGDSTAFALGGMNMTTRDYARFGQMVLNGGVWDGTRVVPESWIAESTTSSAPPPTGGSVRNNAFEYGYQWWIPKDRNGAYMARGVYGQFIWFDTARNVLIVKTAANRRWREPGALARDTDVLDKLAEHYASN